MDIIRETGRGCSELVDRSDGTPRWSREFDPQTIMVSYVPDGPQKRYEGLMLTEISAERQQEPVNAALYVVVNGQLVIEDGIDTGSKAGRVLRPTPLA